MSILKLLLERGTDNKMYFSSTYYSDSVPSNTSIRSTVYGLKCPA